MILTAVRKKGGRRESKGREEGRSADIQLIFSSSFYLVQCP